MNASAKAASVEALVARAREAYAAQDMQVACAAIERAAKQAPDNPVIAFMHAQFAYEGWFESVPLFEHAARLNPGNADLVRNFAFALASEGQGERAQNLLEAILSRNPSWLDGQNTLATLRITTGDPDPLRGFEAALRHVPQNTAIRLAWFHRLAAMTEWDQARNVVVEGAKHDADAMQLTQLFLDCETGEASSDPEIFAPFATSNDPGIALMRVRHALRHGDPELALSIGEAQLDQAHAGQFWPYCSLCWRLLDDPRAQWLDGEPAFADAIDLDVSREATDQWAIFLRRLHTMSAPYPEQSVRGGTQTDRNLLLHHDPLIQSLRDTIIEAVEHWRDALPDCSSDTGIHFDHPFLSRKPGNIRFSGSWSVRLANGGHHSAHTHPQGWASSALYIVVPPENGGEHEGELALGVPPYELNLDLRPTDYITPKPGRLALFPSTTWHGTVPFDGEERLTVAFDVALTDARSIQ